MLKEQLNQIDELQTQIEAQKPLQPANHNIVNDNYYYLHFIILCV